jgi:hypothetical protein
MGGKSSNLKDRKNGKDELPLTKEQQEVYDFLYDQQVLFYKEFATHCVADEFDYVFRLNHLKDTEAKYSFIPDKLYYYMKVLEYTDDRKYPPVVACNINVSLVNRINPMIRYTFGNEEIPTCFPNVYLAMYLNPHNKYVKGYLQKTGQIVTTFNHHYTDPDGTTKTNSKLMLTKIDMAGSEYGKIRFDPVTKPILTEVKK